MAKQYDNTNRGMLFRVTEKESERHPDLNGRIDIDGTEYWLSGWWKKYTDKDTGDERTGVSLSLGKRVESKSQVRRVETQAGAGEREPAPTRRGSGKFDDMEDDIPF